MSNKTTTKEKEDNNKKSVKPLIGEKELEDFKSLIIEASNDDSDEDNDANYIVPNIESKLPKEKKDICREIVAEIKRFGVSQRQLLYIIQLLSMELENIAVMRALVKTIGQYREDIPIGEQLKAQTQRAKKIDAINSNTSGPEESQKEDGKKKRKALIL